VHLLIQSLKPEARGHPASGLRPRPAEPSNYHSHGGSGKRAGHEQRPGLVDRLLRWSCHPLFSLVEEVARTRWPSDPGNPGLLHRTGRSDRHAGGCHEDPGPGRRIVRRTALTGVSRFAGQAGPRLPTLRPNHRKTTQAGRARSTNPHPPCRLCPCQPLAQVHGAQRAEHPVPARPSPRCTAPDARRCRGQRGRTWSANGDVDGDVRH
jgi:hypothetical protein